MSLNAPKPQERRWKAMNGNLKIALSLFILTGVTAVVLPVAFSEEGQPGEGQLVAPALKITGEVESVDQAGSIVTIKELIDPQAKTFENTQLYIDDITLIEVNAQPATLENLTAGGKAIAYYESDDVSGRKTATYISVINAPPKQ